MKKKIIAILLAVLMLSTMLPVTAFAADFTFDSLQGNGTAESPYLIQSNTQLTKFAKAVNNGADGKGLYFKLTNTNPTAHWLPIGTEEHPFRGHFDGGGNIVYLRINKSDIDYVGLFGCTDGAEIKNVYWQGFVTGHSYVGGICGYAENTTISNCGYKNYFLYNDPGPVTGSGDYTGGICGYIDGGSITDCTNDAEITGTENFVGGICGYSGNTSVSGCTNTAEIKKIYQPVAKEQNENETPTSGYVGGIAGYLIGSAENCINYATVDCGLENGPTTSNANDYAGGIAGYFEGRMRSCINKGSVMGRNNIGGLIGMIGVGEGEIINCSNEGEITSYNINCGGLIGSIIITVNETYVIANCVNSGTVNGKTLFGGLAGTIARLSVINYISIGDYAPKNNTSYGAITGTGVDDCKFENTYYDNQICERGDAQGNGTRLSNLGKTTSNMKSAEMLASLNACADKYSDMGLLHWVQGEDGYPRLDYPENEAPSAVGSLISQGDIWIIIGVALVCAAAIAVLVIKNKKKS